MPAYSPTLNVMIQAARKASRRLVRDFGEVENLQVSKKGPADFVSTADTRTEQILREELTRVRPNFGFLMEEGGAVAGNDPDKRWIVDPLDGTLNFLHGLPHFAISIAYEDRGQLIAGVVYNPITDEMFAAEKGRGAYLNDRRLRISGRDRLSEALLATGIPFKGRQGHDRFVLELNALMPEVAGIRRWGAAALDLAYVAAGRYDGFWERELLPWDIAAGIVLVREAGGTVADLSPKDDVLESGQILATNGHIHNMLLSKLRSTG